MYSIAEEDSFLPALLTNNLTQQLAQIKSYREQQKLRQIYLARDMEEIRMAYALRICEERERVRKSLWELDNRKRRLMLQITNTKNPYSNSSSKNKGKSKQRGERQQYQERGKEDRRKDRGRSDKKVMEMKTPASRLPTAVESGSRMNTAVSTRQETRENRKPKWKEKQARPEIPRYLLC